MIRQEKIDNFITKIPPAPEVLKQTLFFLNSGELIKASKVAKDDLALSAYLREIVNKPIYGFKTEIHDVSQIFGILGVARSQQVVYSYMVSLLTPDRWDFFNLDKNKFYSFQAELSANWQKITKYLNILDKEIESSIALLPASIIISEALFCDKKDDVELLRSVKEIDLNTILKRLCDMDLFDISKSIAKKWEMDEKISKIIEASSGIRDIEDDEINLLGKWMHLLLFYTLSKPLYIVSGLNDFIDFNIDYVSDIYEDFIKLMEIK